MQRTQTRHSGLPAPRWNAINVAAFSLVMFFCWLPWLIGLCPGTMNWDTWYQIWQCYPNHGPVYYIPYWPTESLVDYTYTDHHPILDTLIFGFFAINSENATGNWNLGMFYYIMIQSLITVTVLTLSVAYLEKFKLKPIFRLLLFLVFALVPFYPAYGATVLKDTLFSWIYAVFFLMIIHTVRLKGQPLRKWYFVLALILVCLLLCLTKKPGIYAVLGTLVLLAIPYWRQLLQLVLVGVCCGVLMWNVMPNVVFPALDVVPGGKQEALSIPFQQTARYVVMHDDEVTSRERKVIDKVLVYDTLAERYDPTWCDPVKYMWNYKCSDADLEAYYKVYIDQGMKHPETYFDAWFLCVDGYFVPGDPVNIYDWTGSTDPRIEEKVWLPYELKDLREGIVGAYDASVENPWLAPFFQLCLWASWIPGACALVLLLRRWDWLPVLAPVLMSVLVLVVTPITDARYALPVLYADPILVGIALATFPICCTDPTMRERRKRREEAALLMAEGEVTDSVPELSDETGTDVQGMGDSSLLEETQVIDIGESAVDVEDQIELSDMDATGEVSDAVESSEDAAGAAADLANGDDR